MTTVPTTADGSRGASLVERFPAGAHFALTLAISWCLWLATFAALPAASQLAVIPGAFGPGLAAAAVVRLRGGSVRAWLREGFRWRAGVRWYAVALCLPVLAGVAMGILLAVLGGGFEPARLAAFAPTYPVALLFMTLVGGGQEEFGWRGFALPALQRRVDALTASVLVGLGWAVWHLPLFAFGVTGYGGRSFALYALLVVGFSVILTWQYNATGGSVALAMLLHGGVNAASGLGGALVTDPSGAGVPVLLAYALPVWLVAGALVLRYGRETLSPGSRSTAGGRSEPVGSDPAPAGVPSAGRRRAARARPRDES